MFDSSLETAADETIARAFVTGLMRKMWLNVGSSMPPSATRIEPSASSARPNT